jgi:hypothetical protein
MRRTVARLGAVCAWLAVPLAAHGAVTLEVGPNVNASRLAGAQQEAAIAVDPSDPSRLAVVAVAAAGGLFAAYSTDGGTSWTPVDASDGTIAAGDAGDPLAPACCDPSLAFDGFGNLFLAYRSLAGTSVAVALSTDGGRTFAPLTFFSAGTVSQPTVTTGPAGSAGGNAVWVTYAAGGVVVARGAAVTGPGAVGPFGSAQTAPGSAGGDFGDIAVGPDGQVLVAYQAPTAGRAVESGTSTRTGSAGAAAPRAWRARRRWAASTRSPRSRVADRRRGGPRLRPQRRPAPRPRLPRLHRREPARER